MSLVCSECMGVRQLVVQVEPRIVQTCARCGGSGDEPCSAPGCEFSAVTRVAGTPLCDADAALCRMQIATNR
jgi:hypothetical protein